jgi:hypothetical protein
MEVPKTYPVIILDNKAKIYNDPHEAEEHCDDGLVRINSWKPDGTPKDWICDDIDPATAVARDLFGKETGQRALSEAQSQYRETINRAYGIGAGSETNPFSGSPIKHNPAAVNPFAEHAATSDDKISSSGLTCKAERLPEEIDVCIGSSEHCRCLVVFNHCPYPIRVQWHLTNSERKKPWRNTVDPGSRGKFCATRDGTQEPLYLGWYPEMYYPKAGQPAPDYIN